MSLLDNAMEEFTIIDKTTVSDGFGGFTTAYTDGATIQGAIVLNNQTELKVAMAQGVKSVYTLTTKKNVVLQYHQVLRRESDLKIFRVTTDGDDLATPQTANLNMRQVNCEEWELSE